jgi:hypothetical protein
MIKELNKQEIIEIEKKINKLKNNEYYNFYFSEDEEKNFPDKGFLVNKIYYIDFTIYDNKCYMGVINLSPNNIHLKENALFEVIKILKEQLKFYKKIYLWCYIENNIAFRFHKLLINKLNAKQEIIKEKYSLIEVNYENL